MKVSSLSQSQELALPFGDETLNVTIDPSVLTPGLIETLNAAAKSEDVLFVVDIITKLVSEWDLVDDAEVVIPLTPAGVKEVPLVVLGMIFSKVTEALASGADAEGKASAASSLQTAS